MVAIACDESRPIKHRFHGLRAIAKIDGDYYLPELAPITRQVLDEDVTLYRNNETRITLPDTNLIEEIRHIVNRHASNHKWFFDVLRTTEEAIVVQKHIEYWLPLTIKTVELENRLVELLLNLINHNPQLLTSQTVHILLIQDGKVAKDWLDKHFEDVLRVCSTGENLYRISLIADRWERLRIALEEQFPQFEVPKFDADRHQKSEDLDTNLQHSPAYLYLKEQYEAALAGDKKAYFRLQYATRQDETLPAWKIGATHFIGKLIPNYNSVSILSNLLQDNHSDVETMIGRRIEAGEALLQVPTAETWKVMINAYFMESRTASGEYLLKWIAYLTDILSGEIVPQSSYRSLERRPWIRKLRELSVEDVRKLTGLD